MTVELESYIWGGMVKHTVGVRKAEVSPSPPARTAPVCFGWHGVYEIVFLLFILNGVGVVVRCVLSHRAMLVVDEVPTLRIRLFCLNRGITREVNGCVQTSIHDALTSDF